MCWLLKNGHRRKKKKIIDSVLKIEKESINNFIKKKTQQGKKDGC